MIKPVALDERYRSLPLIRLCKGAIRRRLPTTRKTLQAADSGTRSAQAGRDRHHSRAAYHCRAN